MKQYTKAELELLLLDTDDILTASTGTGDFDRADDTDDTGYGEFGPLLG
mgnify:FL=1